MLAANQLDREPALLLIDRGANVKARTVEGLTPLSLALHARNAGHGERMGPMAELLIQHGADTAALSDADKKKLEFAFELTHSPARNR